MAIIRIRDWELHYEQAGSGAPLLLIHGLGSGSADWQAQIEHFSRHYTVIAPDLRGHGRSGRPAPPYAMSDFADDLTALMDALSIADAHVVGISLGGGIAFQLAVQAPARLRSLTVVNSGPELIPRTLLARFAIWQRLVIVKLLGLQRMGKVVAGRMFPDQPELARVFLERFAGNHQPSYLASLRAFIGWSVKARLAEIRCPTLIVAADQDYTPVSLKEDYVKLLPNARLVVIPDSRHALPMEKPAAFNACVDAFLAGLPKD